MAAFYRLLWVIFLLLFTSQASAEKTKLYSELHYTVYDNTKSCELYADYEDQSMLRISYNGSTNKVNLTYYSNEWVKMVDQDIFIISLSTADEPKKHISGVGMIVDKGDQKGIHRVGGEEILNMLQGAKVLIIKGPGLLPLASLDVSGMDPAMKRLRVCGNQKSSD